MHYRVRGVRSDSKGPWSRTVTLPASTTPRRLVRAPVAYCSAGGGHALLAGDDAIVRHRVTNRSDQMLNLRSFAFAPGRSRQTRLVAQLLPGQTTTLEYHFASAEPLRGRRIRLQLRDLDSQRIHNIEVEVQ